MASKEIQRVGRSVDALMEQVGAVATTTEALVKHADGVLSDVHSITTEVAQRSWLCWGLGLVFILIGAKVLWKKAA